MEKRGDKRIYIWMVSHEYILTNVCTCVRGKVCAAKIQMCMCVCDLRINCVGLSVCVYTLPFFAALFYIVILLNPTTTRTTLKSAACVFDT